MTYTLKIKHVYKLINRYDFYEYFLVCWPPSCSILDKATVKTTFCNCCDLGPLT